MATEGIETTAITAIASVVASVATWKLTASKRDASESNDFISSAAKAITESALALVANQEQEVHECQKELAAIKAELADLRARLI